MLIVKHVFDYLRLENWIKNFSTIRFVEFGVGDFAQAPIDRGYHTQSELYVEAQK